MENQNFQIGEVVTWKPSSTINCVGLVFDDLGGETVNVLCVEINGKKAKIKIDVMRNILTKYENNND